MRGTTPSFFWLNRSRSSLDLVVGPAMQYHVASLVERLVATCNEAFVGFLPSVDPKVREHLVDAFEELKALGRVGNGNTSSWLYLSVMRGTCFLIQQ